MHENPSSLKQQTSPFDRSDMTSYSTLIDIMRLSCTVFELYGAFRRQTHRHIMTAHTTLIIELRGNKNYCINHNQILQSDRDPQVLWRSWLAYYCLVTLGCTEFPDSRQGDLTALVCWTFYVLQATCLVCFRRILMVLKKAREYCSVERTVISSRICVACWRQRSDL